MSNHYGSLASISSQAGLITPPSMWQQFTDFANVLKAFIGTSYLSLPFAFKQSGLALGIVALLVIATVTDHCCQMIIKCKNMAVEMVLDSSQHYKDLQNEECYQEMREIKDRLEKEMTLGDIGKIAVGDWGIRIVNFSLMLTQTGFCVAYFIFMGNTLKEMFPVRFYNSTTRLPSDFSSIPFADAAVETTLRNASPMVPPIIGRETAPNFALLLLIPFPFLVLMAFIRNVRKLGPVSGVANIAILAGFIGLLTHILRGLHFKLTDVSLASWITFPIFFGQLTGAFEGIGCIIPIESSMGDNRPRFPLYLHLTLAQVSVILGSFGVLGYLIYGDNVPQIVTDTLPSTIFAQLIRVTLIVAVLFTYPLQLYPVIQITEGFIFKRRLEKRKKHLSEVIAGPSTNLNNKDEVRDYHSINSASNNIKENSANHSYAQDQESKDIDPLIKPNEAKSDELDYMTSPWKRNLLRMFLVTLTAAIAVLLKDEFAYVNAFIGSMGSSVLAYILPCVFHLVLFKDSNSAFVVIKNIILIVFGIVGGIVGIVITVQTIVRDFKHKH